MAGQKEPRHAAVGGAAGVGLDLRHGAAAAERFATPAAQQPVRMEVFVYLENLYAKIAKSAAATYEINPV